MSLIPVRLLVEGLLDEQILRRLLLRTGRYAIVDCLIKGGKAQLRTITPGFNSAAKGFPHVLLTDLDTDACAPSLIESWMPSGCHNNLVFRVAVHEVEAWLLADRHRMADFLQVSISRIPELPDSLVDPKAALIEAAKSSRSRRIREDIVPEGQSTSKVGIGYNAQITDFVLNRWNIDGAREYSPSLARTCAAFQKFEPVFDSAP